MAEGWDIPPDGSDSSLDPDEIIRICQEEQEQRARRLAREQLRQISEQRRRLGEASFNDGVDMARGILSANPALSSEQLTVMATHFYLDAVARQSNINLLEQRRRVPQQEHVDAGEHPCELQGLTANSAELGCAEDAWAEVIALEDASAEEAAGMAAEEGSTEVTTEEPANEGSDVTVEELESEEAAEWSDSSSDVEFELGLAGPDSETDTIKTEWETHSDFCIEDEDYTDTDEDPSCEGTIPGGSDREA